MGANVDSFGATADYIVSGTDTEVANKALEIKKTIWRSTDTGVTAFFDLTSESVTERVTGFNSFGAFGQWTPITGRWGLQVPDFTTAVSWGMFGLDDSLNHISGSFSFKFIMRAINDTVTASRPVIKNGNLSTTGWSVYYTSSTGLWTLYAPSSRGTGTLKLTTDQDYAIHVVLDQPNNTAKLYVDGAVVVSGTYATATSNTQMNIPATSQSSASTVPCSIYKLAFMKGTAMTTAEVLAEATRVTAAEYYTTQDRVTGQEFGPLVLNTSVSKFTGLSFSYGGTADPDVPPSGSEALVLLGARDSSAGSVVYRYYRSLTTSWVTASSGNAMTEAIANANMATFLTDHPTTTLFTPQWFLDSDGSQPCNLDESTFIWDGVITAVASATSSELDLSTEGTLQTQINKMNFKISALLVDGNAAEFKYKWGDFTMDKSAYLKLLMDERDRLMAQMKTTGPVEYIRHGDDFIDDLGDDSGVYVGDTLTTI